MNRIYAFAFLACLTLQGYAQKKAPRANLDTMPVIALPSVKNNAFQEGEVLKFRLHYGIIDAGEAELSVKNTGRKYLQRDTYHIVGTGKTLGAFNWFFKVRDKYETYIDKDGIFPWEFNREIREGSFEKKQDYYFYQHKSAVKTNKNETFAALPQAQDMLSAFYYARTLDFSNAKPGDIFSIPTFVDEENYPLKIRFLGKDELEIREGTFRALKFAPVVQEGRIFKDEEDMIVWITDDKNKIPLLAEAKILVGSIKMELTEYTNLLHPIARVD